MNNLPPGVTNADVDPPNFVFVDEDGPVVRVYDSWGDLDPREFEEGFRHERRFDAERFAKTAAARLGCDWGTNYQ